MSSWFDENNPDKKDENKDVEANSSEEKKENDQDSLFGKTETTEPAGSAEESTDSGNTGWKPADSTQNSQWVSPSSVYPQNASQWNSAANSSPQTNGQTPAGGQMPTGMPDGKPDGTPDGTPTYHYGVNAPSPVPNNTNQYTGQPQYNNPPRYNNTPRYNNQTGYNPQQGGYYPYNWQQTPPQQSMQPKPPKKKKNGAAIAIATLSVVCAAAIITLSVLLAGSLSRKGFSNNTTASSSSTTKSTNSNAPSLKISENDADAQGLSTRSIVEMNLSSTVVITIYDNQSTFGFGGGSQLAEVGAASGIIMSTDGYIITNWHVVINENTGKAYSRIDVKTYDGTVYKGAEIIGADQDTDLAVIKVSAAKLTPAKFGDSSALKLGDKIVAIGNAGGLEYTTTQGIVSGLARDVYDDTGYAIKCLQIDAAINPGNSGGPLLNAQGQVVGVNSAKIVAEGYEGLGFSIPIKEAKAIVDNLIKYGYVKNRVMLGITGITITQPGFEGFQIKTIDNSSVLQNTQARVGDIITKINTKAITTGNELRSELSKLKVGDKITLTLLRVNTQSETKDTFTITVTLKEYNGGQ